LQPSSDSLPARIAALLDRLSAWASPRRERLRKWGLAGALIVFVAGLAWAIRATPELELQLGIGPLILLLLLSAPAGTVLNTIELHALSRIAGGPMSWRTSAELTVYTSAANMLPLPGGVVTKLAGMKAHGVSYATATAVLVLSFFIWGSLAFLCASAALLALGKATYAAIFAGVGVALLVIAAIGSTRFKRWRWIAVVVTSRATMLALEIVRYVLAVGLVGVSISFFQAATFVVASLVGAAVVVAPQGLGVIEATTALLSSLIGLSAGIGFLAAAITRIARLAGLALIAAGLLIVGRRPSPAPDFEDHSGLA